MEEGSHRSLRRNSVSNDSLLATIKVVMQQCHDAATSLCNGIRSRFPPHELLDAFSIIYPQFWLEDDCEDLFEDHLKTL